MPWYNSSALGINQSSRLDRVIPIDYTLKTPPNRRRNLSLTSLKNIRALNTITKLLSYIPRNEPLAAKDNLSNKKWQSLAVRQELKLLDAFAQLIVSFREVAAMVSNRAVDLQLLGSISDSQEDMTNDTDEGKGLDKSASIVQSLI